MTEIKQTMAEVQAEARRCLYCVDAPCQQGCPAGVDVAQFIRHLRYADVKSAKRVIKTANPLGGICGTLCPSENLCQKNCTMNYCGAPIHIRDWQKFACANAAYTPELAPASGKKAAVVGAGPAGLGCAAMLARLGHEVDVFEKDAAAAGVVAREIPAERIDAAVVENDLAELSCERIHFHYNTPVTPQKLEELKQEYAAVFVGAGLAQDRMSGVDIAEGAPVVGCSQYLADLKSGKTKAVSGTVLVVGGGDSAIDAVCASLEAGAEKAVLAYRRSRAEMPACDEEFFAAADKGVELMYMVSPVAIAKTADGGAAVTFVRNRLVEKPGEARRGFEAVPGSEFTLNVAQVVFAIGKKADAALVAGTPDKDTLRVAGTNCFVGGDWLNGGATVVKAVAEGKRAAAAMDALMK